MESLRAYTFPSSNPSSYLSTRYLLAECKTGDVDIIKANLHPKRGGAGPQSSSTHVFLLDPTSRTRRSLKYLLKHEQEGMLSMSKLLNKFLEIRSGHGASWTLSFCKRSAKYYKLNPETAYVTTEALGQAQVFGLCACGRETGERRRAVRSTPPQAAWCAPEAITWEIKLVIWL